MYIDRHKGYIMGPRIKGKNTRIPIHRIILEKKIGRKLQKGEVAHHLNKDKLDNSDDNLVALYEKDHDKIPQYSDQLILDYIRELYVELHRIPKLRDLKKFSGSIYYRRFGLWKTTIRLALN